MAVPLPRAPHAKSRVSLTRHAGPSATTGGGTQPQQAGLRRVSGLESGLAPSLSESGTVSLWEAWIPWQLHLDTQEMSLEAESRHPNLVPHHCLGYRGSLRGRGRGGGWGGRPAGQVESLGCAGITNPGLSALQPALQRWLGQQGVAACAGELSASSPCPTECLSLHCCRHALTDPGSPLGKTPA